MKGPMELARPINLKEVTLKAKEHQTMLFLMLIFYLVH
jgi:hypothetical protein